MVAVVRLKARFRTEIDKLELKVEVELELKLELESFWPSVFRPNTETKANPLTLALKKYR